MVNGQRVTLGIERQMYVGGAVFALLVVLVGFARTYYLKAAFDGGTLTALVHAHGALMTAWFALFLVQALLVARRSVRAHRRLGKVAFTLVPLALVTGVATATAAARKGATDGGLTPLEFLIIPFFDIVIFAALAGAGLVLRHRVDWHRRLMLVATLGTLAPAVARIPLEVVARGGPLVYFGVPDLCVLAALAVDTVRHRRLHPAFVLGAAVVILSQPARLFLMRGGSWLRFAAWLVG